MSVKRITVWAMGGSYGKQASEDALKLASMLGGVQGICGTAADPGLDSERYECLSGEARMGMLALGST